MGIYGELTGRMGINEDLWALGRALPAHLHPLHHVLLMMMPTLH